MKLRHGGLILVLLNFSQVFGQTEENIYKPFTILIISPDTARLEPDLEHFTDSIELEYRRTYYNAIKELRKRGNIEEGDKKRETEMTIQRAQWMEMEIYDFKYYQLISIGTFVALLEAFNKYSQEKKSLTCEIEEKRWLYTYDLGKLANYYDVDYIVYFKNIKAVKNDDGTYSMNMKTGLFSREDSKVIMEKKTEGTSENVYCVLRRQNKLMCLLTTLFESSSSELITVLTERQKK